MTVVVAGGGIAGLAAALDLGRAGIPTLLVEASSRLGGKIATERVDGFVVERGPDSFLTTRPAAVELARELGLGEELISTSGRRTVYVLHDGRLVPMPDGLGLVLPTRVVPFAVTRLFSPREKARMALDVVLPRLARDGDEPIGAFLRRRLGGAMVDRLADPLVGGIYGAPVDELSLDAVVPQLRAAERDHRSLLFAGLADGRRMRRARPATGGSRLGVFASLAGGMAGLVEAAGAALEASPDVTIRTRTAVRGLERLGGGAVVRLSDGTSVRADAVILALPGPDAARLLDAEVPQAAAAVGAVPHGSSAIVSLGYSRSALSRPLEGHGFLVPRSAGMTIAACTWTSEKWPGRAPADAVLLRAFIQDPPHDADDGALAVAARLDIEPTLGIAGRPTLVRVARWRRAMPRYTVGHLDRVAAAERAIRSWPALELAGSAYHGVGVPDCIRQGREAAGRVATRLAGSAAIRGSAASSA